MTTAIFNVLEETEHEPRRLTVLEPHAEGGPRYHIFELRDSSVVDLLEQFARSANIILRSKGGC